MNIQDLIGLDYPVTDVSTNTNAIEGGIPVTRKITFSMEISNYAGIAIKLDNYEAGILISYTRALEILKQKEKRNENVTTDL